MTTYTSIHTSPPTCENCGRDKQVTYICDACCAKLNAATRKLTAERDELQRRLDEIAKHAAAPNWGDMVCAGGKLELATTRLDEIRAIAEGRDNG